jgi:hypothetical protein
LGIADSDFHPLRLSRRNVTTVNPIASGAGTNKSQNTGWSVAAANAVPRSTSTKVTAKALMSFGVQLDPVLAAEFLDFLSFACQSAHRTGLEVALILSPFKEASSKTAEHVLERHPCDAYSSIERPVDSPMSGELATRKMSPASPENLHVKPDFARPETHRECPGALDFVDSQRWLQRRPACPT